MDFEIFKQAINRSGIIYRRIFSLIHLKFFTGNGPSQEQGGARGIFHRKIEFEVRGGMDVVPPCIPSAPS
jgi:hypothetical protein